MRTLKFMAFVLVIAALASCGGKTGKSENQSDASETTIEKSDKSSKQKYAIKSGIVEYSTKMMGMEMAQKLYFDDYGAKEATEVEMDIMGMKVTTITIMKEGYIYTINPEAKTGTKTAITGSGPNIDFRNLTKDLEDKMKLKKLGKESFLGKNCEKYSIDYADMRMTGTFLVWEGIALKTEATIGGTEMVMVAKSVEGNASVPSAKFDIPDDIVFQ